MDEREKLANLFAEALCNGAKQHQQKNDWGVLFNVYVDLQGAGFTEDESMQILLGLLKCAFEAMREDED